MNKVCLLVQFMYIEILVFCFSVVYYIICTLKQMTICHNLM